MKVTISGFYDEISGDLNKQIAVMHELNENYMCPRTINNKNIADYTAEEFERDIYPILQKEGIKFSSIGSPIGKVGIDDEEGFEKQKKQLAELIKIAQLMDCKYIRMFSFFYGDKDPASCHDKVIARLKELLAIAKGSGVKLMHENEKLIYGDVPDRVLAIKKEIDDPDFVFCFDASNFVQCDVDPQVAFDQLADIVVYYHIKDCSSYKVEVPVGTGEGKYDYIMAKLKERNYEGFMTMEPHTWKYAVLKPFVYFVPFVAFVKKDYYRAFRLIDKKMHKCFFACVSRKTVFLWQYNNLKKLLEA